MKIRSPCAINNLSTCCTQPSNVGTARQFTHLKKVNTFIRINGLKRKHGLMQWFGIFHFG